MVYNFIHSLILIEHKGEISRTSALTILEQERGLIKNSIAITKNKFGKPDLMHNGALFGSVSIAHTKDQFALLYSPEVCELGVDIENSINDEMLVHEFLSPKEIEYMITSKQNRIQESTLIWTLKEAFVKALGVGFKQHPNTVCVADILKKEIGDEGSIVYQGRVYKVHLVLKKIEDTYCVSGVAIIK